MDNAASIASIPWTGSGLSPPPAPEGGAKKQRAGRRAAIIGIMVNVGCFPDYFSFAEDICFEGSRCQISSLYSVIVRSEEKMPLMAVLVTAIFSHFLLFS